MRLEIIEKLLNTKRILKRNIYIYSDVLNNLNRCNVSLEN